MDLYLCYYYLHAGTAHMVWLRSLSKQNDAEANFTRVLHEYTIDGGSHVFRGYAVHASRRLIQTVQLAPEVLYVEHNQVVHALQDNTCIRQNEATWVSVVACFPLTFLSYSILCTPLHSKIGVP